MKCKYYNKCPSCSAWCNNSQPSEHCIEFILSAYETLKDKHECDVYTFNKIITIMREEDE